MSDPTQTAPEFKIVKVKDPATGKEIEVKVKAKIPEKPKVETTNIPQPNSVPSSEEEPKKHPGGRPLLFTDLKKLEQKINRYFRSCWHQKIDMWGNPIYSKDKKGKKTDKKVMVQFKPYTVAGLAVYLDCSEETLLNYEKEKNSRKEFFGTIKRAKDIIYSYKQEFLYSGKNPTGAIFDLKNNYGWKDKVETEHSGNITWIEEPPK